MSISETYSNRTITAFFDTRDDAQRAIDRLKDLGLSDGSVKLVRGDDATFTDREDDRGFWESLSDFFFPDDDRAAYAEGLRRGGFLVTATDIPSDRYSEALDILDDEGSVDVDARSASWRSEGWTGSSVANASGTTSAVGYAAGGTGVGTSDPLVDSMTPDLTGTRAYNASASANADLDMTADTTAGRDYDTFREDASLSGEAISSSATPIASDAARLDSTYSEDRTALGGSAYGTDRSLSGDRDEDVIPVMEERLKVGKREASGGRVRVRSYVIEEPASADVNLRDERVFVERRPVDRALSGDETAFTDRTIEAEEHIEEAVVAKEARVKEEIALRKEAEERTETVSDTVRRTEVEIEDERTGGATLREGTTGSSTFTDRNRT